MSDAYQQLEAANTDAPSLRPHHFICLQFYRGEGYPADYVKNLLGILEVASHTPCTVVEGADDVCRACPDRHHDGSCLLEPHGETGIRKLDSLAARLLDLSTGDSIAFSDTHTRLRPRIRDWVAEACDGCRFMSSCSDTMTIMYSSELRSVLPVSD